MSFDVNPPSSKPIIREAASMQNDGGAGNLGYFERGEGKEKKKKDESIFGKDEVDSFKKSSDVELENDDFSLSKWIAEIILKVKAWFKNLFG